MDDCLLFASITLTSPPNGNSYKVIRKGLNGIFVTTYKRLHSNDFYMQVSEDREKSGLLLEMQE